MESQETQILFISISLMQITIIFIYTMFDTMEENCPKMQVQKIKLNGVAYKNENTYFLMDKISKSLEYQLFDYDLKLAYKFLINRRDVKKVKVTPDNILIEFKKLRVLEAVEGNVWKTKYILKDKWISCLIKFSEEEIRKNMMKIGELKEQRRRRLERVDENEGNIEEI